MKKFFTTSAFVLVFGFYVLNQYLNSASAVSYAATAPAATPKNQTAPSTFASAAPPTTSVAANTPAPATVSTSNPPTQSTQTSTPAPAPKPTPTPVPTPAPKPTGQYVDGTYTGPSVNAYYGYVQVQAVISSGRISNVTFLSYPSDRNTSRWINSQAMPLLTQEAVQVQNANVDGVSGASDTSAAFKQSLASALSQAKS